MEGLISNSSVKIKNNKIRLAITVVHIILSFWWERRILIFDLDKDIVATLAKTMIISDEAERVMGYVIAKILAIIIIYYVWKLIFYLVENYKVNNYRIFTAIFAVGTIYVCIMGKYLFNASEDNAITLSYALRLFPEYWHNAYSSCIYTACFMVLPFFQAIGIFQWLLAIFIIGYLYNRIQNNKILVGKSKWCVLLIFLLPGTDTLFTNAYRTEQYALVCMLLMAIIVFDIIEQRERSLCQLIAIMALCAFVSVWRAEGVIFGIPLFLGLLWFGYNINRKTKILLSGGIVALFMLFSIPQKVGEIKYYGKDYSYINTFTVLKNILNSENANLNYLNAKDDIYAINEVTPICLIQTYGMDGYRRFNYYEGRKDINQSMADNTTASAYVKAYVNIIRHNMPIYCKTQYSMVLKVLDISNTTLDIPVAEKNAVFLSEWHLEAWDNGQIDVDNLVGEKGKSIYNTYGTLVAIVKEILQFSHFNTIILLMVPCVEIVIVINEILKVIKKKKNLIGIAGVSVVMLGQALAIVLVMPAPFLVYFHSYYYCSVIMIIGYIVSIVSERNCYEKS